MWKVFEAEVIAGLNQPVKMLSFEYTTPERTADSIECIQKLDSLHSNMVCNYSPGETMRFALENWVDAATMIDIIQSPDFIATSAGDIYIRNTAG